MTSLQLSDDVGSGALGTRYLLVDLAASYASRISGYDVTFRAAIDHLLDRHEKSGIDVPLFRCCESAFSGAGRSLKPAAGKSVPA